MRRSFLTLTLGLLAACSSTSKGAETGKTVESAAAGVERGIGELEATVAALNQLVKHPAPDLAPQYKAFTKSLAQLEATAKDVSETAARIDERSQAYFAQWDTQIAAIQNEDIKGRSSSRREAVSASFSKLQKEYGEVREEFKPLLDNLRDIRTVLGTDLTMDGLKSVADTAEDIDDDAKDVKESLQALAENFKKLGVGLKQAGPAAEKAEAGKK